MRDALLCLLLCGIAGFAQNPQSVPSPGNAASNALSQRLHGMDLLGMTPGAPARAKPGLDLLHMNPRAPKQIRLAQAMPPRVCAIPLLRANPATSDAMHVVQPKAGAAQTSRDELKQVPAPACDDQVTAK